ncbi:DinB family protein [Pseudomonas typographi]|uniref:DinB family protein n=1 Tax=Pseudomonas typographi TaxID=2715964 RepID=UPI0016846BB9|nr:DinB family protein [Pseudomonas typographi]MBD1585589.1 damage-inducible protein DinB [Pseudomonas typographi]
MNTFLAQAQNNQWANRRLLYACSRLSQAEYEAPRTGFFPSIEGTLRHILDVDVYYLAALEFDLEGQQQALPERLPFQRLAPLQRVVDARLATYCEGLDPQALARTASLIRAQGIVLERVDRLLLHLFQHQIHHRGQVHAMLSATTVAPPQLDEFYLDGDRALRRSDEIQFSWDDQLL